MMKEIIIVADYTEETSLSAAEICEICRIDLAVLREYVSYGIVSQRGSSPEKWEFTMVELTRIRTALRLQHDLEINYAGIALVMQLLDEMEDLRGLSAIYNRHFIK